MATVVLQVVGAAIGGAMGGPAGAAVGRALGAAAGYAIDQTLFTKDQLIRGGRLEDSRILASSDGAVIPRAYGRVRLGGQLIWATRFEEIRSVKKRGGKGGPSVKTESFSYYGNFAIGICEGEINHIGSIWADGKEIDQTKHVIRVYKGTPVQLPDPLIESKQGFGLTPAFRGTAYVVFEDFPLADYGNRIPQISFEVIRSIANVDRSIRAVTLIPGASEFGYLPSSISSTDAGVLKQENTHTLLARSDWQASLDELQAICPQLERVSLVVTWFGTDLRAGNCRIEPKVSHHDNQRPAWVVSGTSRSNANLVSAVDGEPAFGGTPTDESIVKAIQDLKARGLKVTFYPFIMMDIPPDNQLPDPYGGSQQPAFPWRGRVSCYPAIGQPDSPDGTVDASTQIGSFLGLASVADFSSSNTTINYNGPAEWSYRRMILHYAHLCELAGGVDAFLIGSEMRGLTRVRGDAGSFPFVDGLISVATDCRQVLDPATKISYAADWSEYFGYQPGNASNDVYFNLDPLWADISIDAVAIDNYMPMANWHDIRDHTRPLEKSIYSHEYLKSNILGGEGYDWYYASKADRENHIVTPITDGLGEPWIWSYKNIPQWWASFHHERIGGLRSGQSTSWQPGSKPVWFAETGCPAVDRGANQPNVFVDPKSAESKLPRFSKGARDDLMLLRCIEAQLEFWSGDSSLQLVASLNPNVDFSQMIRPSDITVWTWDARPFPAFPQKADLWNDASNWYRGHWLNGRLGTCPMDDLIKAIFSDFGLEVPECKLDGHCQGFVVAGETSARTTMEPLLLLNNITTSESNGRLVFSGKAYHDQIAIDENDMVQEADEAQLSLNRQSELELPREVLFSHADIDLGFDTITSSSRRMETNSDRQVKSELPMVLCRDEATRLAQARLRDFWIGRDTAQLQLPWKYLSLEQGDILRVGNNQAFQVRDIMDGLQREIEAGAFQHFEETLTWMQPPVNRHSQTIGEGAPEVLLMNLPLDQDSMQPQPRIYAAASAAPWNNRYPIEMSPISTGFEQVGNILEPAVIFIVQNAVGPSSSGRWDYANHLDVTVTTNTTDFLTVEEELVFAGGNALAVQTNSGGWEIIQFRKSEITGLKTWRLSQLLRGQLGTDHEMRSAISAGAKGVLLNSAIVPVFLEKNQVGLPLNWRIGPSGAAIKSITALSETCSGINGRPLTPCHLKARFSSGACLVSWIRRSRVNSDSWDNVEVEPDFSIEAYNVEIHRPNGQLLRSVPVTESFLNYSDSARLGDLGSLSEPFIVAVSQLSNSSNPGPAASITVNP